MVVGILVVSYGAREAAMVDAFIRSNYTVDLYVIDKQRNPFNLRRAKEHVVIPTLSVKEIEKYVKKRLDKIDFGIVGPEKPIIDGIRDVLEGKFNIPVICPTKEYALESSKIKQRLLLSEVAPEVNPRFKIFRAGDFSTESELIKAVKNWIEELGGADKAVIKPDRPGYGKGVGVGGEHFFTMDDAVNYFLSLYSGGKEGVVIEERLIGEESSFQSFCDGKRIVPLPETRDYKRAFDGDRGVNTGGMGSYKDKGDILPFMEPEDREKEIEIVNKVFKKLCGNSSNENLKGMPFYVAFIHTKDGPKILEINSRPGDPEIQNLLPIMKNDFVDLCYDIIDGKLTVVDFERKATVVTYKVPPSYGNFEKEFPDRVKKSEVGGPIDLRELELMAFSRREEMRVYPASMEIREDGSYYALTSRTICVVGIGDDLEEARNRSLSGIRAIKGGSLWYRTDIASKRHIARSIERMKKLKRLS